MFLAYLRDQNALGFSPVIKPKRVKNRKQMLKERVVSVIIFATSVFTKVDVHMSSRSVFSVCFIRKPNSLNGKTIYNSTKVPSPILDSILHIIKDYNDDLNQKQIEVVHLDLQNFPKIDVLGLENLTEMDDLSLANLVEIKDLALQNPAEMDNFNFQKLTKIEDGQRQKLTKSILAKCSNISVSRINIIEFSKKLYAVVKWFVCNPYFWVIIVTVFDKPFEYIVKIAPADFKEIRSKFNEIRSDFDEIRSDFDKIRQSYRPEQAKSLVSNVSKNLNDTSDLGHGHKALGYRPLPNPISWPSGELQKSGLHRNHDYFSEIRKFIDERTSSRKAGKLYNSQVLKKQFKYSQIQLEEKGDKHLWKDYRIPQEGKSPQEIAANYFYAIEDLLKTPNLKHWEYGTFSKIESAYIIGDPKSLKIVIFEKSELHNDYFFISSYVLSRAKFAKFVKTGCVGADRPSYEEQYLNSLKVKASQPKGKKLPYSKPKLTDLEWEEVFELLKKIDHNPKMKLTSENEKILKQAKKANFTKVANEDKDEL